MSSKPDVMSAAPQQPLIAAQPAAKTTSPVRIAMILPLSGRGPAFVVGKSMKQAGELALFEQNNPLVQLIVKDSKGTAVGAAAAAGEAIREGAEVIVGPMTSAATRAVSPIAQQANVPVLSFSNDARVASSGVYLMGALPEQEVDRIVSYASQQGKRRFAALIPSDPYGDTIDPVLRRAIQRSGGTVATVARYPLDPNVMLPAVRTATDQIKINGEEGAPIDALLLAGGPDIVQRLSTLVAYSGLNKQKNIQVLGVGNWDFPSAGRNEILDGSWYPGPDQHGCKEFHERFTSSFGTPPPRIATYAYDAVSLAIGLSAQPKGLRFTVANLTRPTGFQGLAGWVRFGPDGKPHRRLAVMELQKFGSSLRDAGTTSTPAVFGQSTPLFPSPLRTGTAR